jgi:hypothetical protein
MPRPSRGIAPILCAALILLPFVPVDAGAIPAFARKYRATCALCHAPVPRLTAFGEEFAGNGFVFVRGEAPTDTLNTGDPLLRLQRNIPLAVRFDAYMNSLSGDGDVVASDLKIPWGIKLLTGGQVTENVSYYMYFYMSERGEVAGLEDAYLQFNDVFGSGVDVIAGQFQVSDPMFKRELRLEFEDYQPYRVRVGDVRADLTYERGLLATTSLWEDGDIVVEVVNGHGLEEASSDKNYDRDSGKNVAVRVTQDLGLFRVGGFFYGGTEKAEGINSTLQVWGGDATVPLGSKVELNLQYLYRNDENPFFLDACASGDFMCDFGASDPFESSVDGYMAELFMSPDGAMGDWHFTALYNRIESDRPVFRLRMGEQNRGVGYLDRYETIAVGAHYIKARNLRFMAEVGRDFELDRTRITAGVTTAF